MRKLHKGITFFLFLFAAYASNAQENEIDLFVKDMLIIADDFATPAAESSAYTSGAGWFTSATNLELWQVDLSLQANILLVPEKKRNIEAGNFNIVRIKGVETAEVPTAFGGLTDVEYEVELFGNQISFDAIDGINKSILAHPFLQASVGLPYGTEITARFLPETKIDDVRFSTYGIGLKHNFNQYFLNSQPDDFQFAAFVAYSKYIVNYAFPPVEIPHDFPGFSPYSRFENIDVDANILLLQLISSKTFRSSGWSAFGSVGLSTSDFSYIMGGQGELIPAINTELETLSNNEVEFKGDIGLTYDTGDFLFSGMFSQGKFSNLNLSLHYQL